MKETLKPDVAIAFKGYHLKSIALPRKAHQKDVCSLRAGRHFLLVEAADAERRAESRHCSASLTRARLLQYLIKGDLMEDKIRTIVY